MGRRVYSLPLCNSLLHIWHLLFPPWQAPVLSFSPPPVFQPQCWSLLDSFQLVLAHLDTTLKTRWWHSSWAPLWAWLLLFHGKVTCLTSTSWPPPHQAGQARVRQQTLGVRDTQPRSRQDWWLDAWRDHLWGHGAGLNSSRTFSFSLWMESKSGSLEIAQRQCKKEKPLLLLLLLQPSCYSQGLIWNHVLPVRFRPQNWLLATFPCCFFLGSLYECSLSHPALC